MTDDERSDAEQVLAELDPQPAHEAIRVSRRQTLRALASVGALTTVGSASGQSAGTVVADEAYFANYGWEPSAEGGTLTIDGDQYTFDGSEEIGLDDGGVGTELVTPSGQASELIGPSGQVLWSVIPDSGMLRWLFEESLEDSWNNNDLTGHATGYSSTTGVAEGNYARDYDGIDDYDDFDAVLSSPDQSLSIIASVYPEALSGSNRQIIKWGDAPPHFDLGYIDNNSSWKWGFFDGSTFHGQLSGATTTPTGEISHLCGTFNASTGDWTFYRNGSEVWSVTDDVDVAHNGSVGIVGATNNGSNDNWDGYIDGIDFYNKELTATEVSNHYSTGNI